MAGEKQKSATNLEKASQAVSFSGVLDGSFFEPQLLSYKFAECVLDLPVPGDWRPASVVGVEEYVVSPPRR